MPKRGWESHPSTVVEEKGCCSLCRSSRAPTLLLSPYPLDQATTCCTMAKDLVVLWLCVSLVTLLLSIAPTNTVPTLCGGYFAGCLLPSLCGNCSLGTHRFGVGHCVGNGIFCNQQKKTKRKTSNKNTSYNTSYMGFSFRSTTQKMQYFTTGQVSQTVCRRALCRCWRKSVLRGLQATPCLGFTKALWLPGKIPL